MPPTSWRSQSASSGNIDSAVCSTACRPPIGCRPAARSAAGNLVGDLEPDARRLDRGRREIERLAADQLLPVHAAPLEAGDARRHAQPAAHQPEVAGRPRRVARQDLGLLLRQRAREPRRVDGAHAHELLLEVQLGDEVLPAAVQIDRALVALGEHAARADRADLDGAFLFAGRAGSRSWRRPDADRRRGAGGGATRTTRRPISLRRMRPRSSTISTFARTPGSASQASPARSGISSAAQGRCAAATSTFVGSTTACSKPRSKSIRGCATRYWSSASGCAISTTTPSCARPTRPARCHVAICEPGYPTRMQTSRPPTSMPISSAEVEITPSSAPENSFCSISRRSSGRKPARYDEIRSRSCGSASITQVWISSVTRRALVNAIVRKPETDREAEQLRRRGVGRGPDRVHQHHVAARARRAVGLDHRGDAAGERLRQFARIRDRRRGADDLRAARRDAPPRAAAAAAPARRARRRRRGRCAARRSRRGAATRRTPSSSRASAGCPRAACRAS